MLIPKMVKVFKWTFLTLWILCAITFIIGQYLVPPNNHLLLGNYWRALFGKKIYLYISEVGNN